MDRNCQEFLRGLTINAYYQKGKATGLGDMIDNSGGGILWEAQQKIEKHLTGANTNICLTPSKRIRPQSSVSD
jgi:hypothetical protein